ncbi:hypothetical protein [Pontimicrobium sp. MEBiC01747]|jgi:uncharacterized membrane protein
MKINENLIYKWTLRFQYIWPFLAGAAVTAPGISGLLGFETIIDVPEANLFFSIIMVIIGIALIIAGFYKMREIEYYIKKHNL